MNGKREREAGKVLHGCGSGKEEREKEGRRREKKKRRKMKGKDERRRGRIKMLPCGCLMRIREKSEMERAVSEEKKTLPWFLAPGEIGKGTKKKWEKKILGKCEEEKKN